MSDARKFSRVPFHVQVAITVGDRSIELDTVDISLKGILVHNHLLDNLELGKSYPLNLRLPGSDIVLSFDGKVVHQHIDVVGFSFESMDLDSATHLRCILAANLGDAETVSKELEFLKD